MPIGNFACSATFCFYQCLDIKLDFTCGRNQIVHHMGEKPTKEALGPRNED